MKEVVGLVGSLLAFTLAITACGDQNSARQPAAVAGAAPADWGPCRPGTKVVSLADLKERLRFDLLSPPPSGPLSHLLRVAVAWVRPSAVPLAPPADPAKGIRLPSRQAAALYYSLTGNGRTVVLQERGYPGATPESSLMEVVGQGYFFARQPLGCRLFFNRVRGTNVGVITTELTQRQEHQLIRELKWPRDPRR